MCYKDILKGVFSEPPSENWTLSITVGKHKDALLRSIYTDNLYADLGASSLLCHSPLSVVQIKSAEGSGLKVAHSFSYVGT